VLGLEARGAQVSEAHAVQLVRHHRQDAFPRIPGRVTAVGVTLAEFLQLVVEISCVSRWRYQASFSGCQPLLLAVIPLKRAGLAVKRPRRRSVLLLPVVCFACQVSVAVRLSCLSRTSATRDSGHHSRFVSLFCCLPARHVALASMVILWDAVPSK
jgi:hypothetical protein